MIAQLIGQGIGFTPGSVKYIVTDGLSIGEAEEAVAGSYEGVSVKKRRVLIEGKSYLVTQSEERRLVEDLLDTLQTKVEAKPSKVTPKVKATRTTHRVDTRAVLQERIDVLKIRQALLTEEGLQEARLLEAMKFQAYLQLLDEDEAIALLLAVA